jgi:hypothetical protein
MKRSGLGWGQVFNQMKAGGHIQAKNLGQLASHFVREQRALSGSPRTATTGESRRNQAGRGKVTAEATGSGGDIARQAGAAVVATGAGDRGQAIGHGTAGPGGGAGIALAEGRAR